MAKGGKNFIPGLSGTSQQAARQIIRFLDESRETTRGMSTSTHFAKSLAIWQAVLNQAQMREWLAACAGVEHGLAPLGKALGILMQEATYNYQDILGAIYMFLSQGDRRMGQYFTPYGVARLMAGINFSDLRPLAPGQPPIKVMEPACGSGALILAAAEEVEERYPGMIARGEVQFFGIDIDSVCAAMCQLNMHLHGIGRVVKLNDELTEEEQACFKEREDAGRPVKCAFQAAKVVCGNVLDPETEKLFAEENPWIPFLTWQKDGTDVTKTSEEKSQENRNISEETPAHAGGYTGEGPSDPVVPDGSLGGEDTIARMEHSVSQALPSEFPPLEEVGDTHQPVGTNKPPIVSPQMRQMRQTTSKHAQHIPTQKKRKRRKKNTKAVQQELFPHTS